MTELWRNNVHHADFTDFSCDSRNCMAKPFPKQIRRKRYCALFKAVDFRSAPLPRRFRETALHIFGNRADHGFHMRVFEEVARAFDLGVGDRDALLLVQFVDKRVGVTGRRDAVAGAVDDQTRRRAGGEE